MPAKPQHAPRLIETDADVATGIRALRRKCPIIRRMHDVTGLPPLRRREGGFPGLARIVVGQQLSVASSMAIWERTEKAVSPFAADALLATPEDVLRAAGLSAGKVRTLRAIAAAIAHEGLDLDELAEMDAGGVHQRLTSIKGIGPWTADVYVLFCIGHADGFASGDLALQVALQIAADMENRPTAKDLEAFAERWRPWRGVAARLLWAYYKARKDAGSGMPL